MKFTYMSNNSGGRWWLSDEDWLRLEQEGWEVDWYRDNDSEWMQPLISDGRMLGALASKASKGFETLDDAIDEWESLTGQSFTDLGCGCCGCPHSFSWDGGYKSGSDFWSPTR